MEALVRGSCPTAPGLGSGCITNGLQLSRALSTGTLGRLGQSMSVDPAGASLNEAGGGGSLPARGGAGRVVGCVSRGLALWLGCLLFCGVLHPGRTSRS